MIGCDVWNDKARRYIYFGWILSGVLFLTLTDREKDGPWSLDGLRKQTLECGRIYQSTLGVHKIKILNPLRTTTTQYYY